MKARAGCHIYIKVGVVHTMQSPEPGNVMKKPVLGIDGKVEKKDGYDDRQ